METNLHHLIHKRREFTLQSASLRTEIDCGLQLEEKMERLATDDNVDILPPDKGRVTVVMDKKD